MITAELVHEDGRILADTADPDAAMDGGYWAREMAALHNQPPSWWVTYPGRDQSESLHSHHCPECGDIVEFTDDCPHSEPHDAELCERCAAKHS